MDPVIASILAAVVSSGVTGLGSYFAFRGKRAEVDAGMREHIDNRMDAYVDRIEAQLDDARDRFEKHRLESDKKIAELQRRVNRLTSENRELRTFAAAVRHDLRAIHRSIYMASRLLQTDEDGAHEWMQDSLSRLDSLLEETHTLVEDSAPKVET